ncbi:MAG TPA: hypothetical protein VGI57_12730 [Usitatibacter sp.]
MQALWSALRFVAFVIAAALVAPAFAQDKDPGSVEREVRARLDAMRSVQATDKARADEINRQMDDTWKYFDTNRAKAFPVLRTELAAEVRRPNHSPFMLLVAGFYLYTHGDKSDAELGKVALFAIDASAPVVRWNLPQYFYFVYAVASEHDSRVLPLIDSVFLDKKVPLVIPEYALNLDESLVCMLLYGAYGEGAEEHLQPFLQNPARVRKVLEILIWIGSPASNNAVLGAIRANRDLEVFARAMTFLMQSGGPEGRDILLKLDPAGLDPQSADALNKSRSHVEAVTAGWYKSLLDRFPGATTIPDAELRKRLAATAKGTGGDQALSPRAIYASGIPRDELIAGLTAARNTMLQHLYDQVLQDVRTTDTVINGLRFRDH